MRETAVAMPSSAVADAIADEVAGWEMGMRSPVAAGGVHESRKRG
jgi:hypothetical protein